MITLKIKSGTARLRRLIGTIVVVTIRIKEENVAEKLRNYLYNDAKSFISTMKYRISQSPALTNAGVELGSVTDVSCEGCGKSILIIEHIKISSIIKWFKYDLSKI